MFRPQKNFKLTLPAYQLPRASWTAQTTQSNLVEGADSSSNRRCFTELSVRRPSDDDLEVNTLPKNFQPFFGQPQEFMAVMTTGPSSVSSQQYSETLVKLPTSKQEQAAFASSPVMGFIFADL